jgi:FtsH-binding integral membrane protein
VNQLATDGIAPAKGQDESAYFTQVFGWMAAGLTVTGGVAAAVYGSGTALHAFEGSSGPTIFIILAVLELALVAGLVGLVQHMSLFETGATYLAYCVLNGVTFSVIFLAYTTTSIVSTFLVTAAMFGAIGLWGYATKRDLTGWGTFLFMALIGQLIGLVVNLFWLNNTLYLVTTAVGVLIFAGYTAYDVQRLKKYEPPPGADYVVVEKDAIVGALALYLDFVNLFLYLLRILGKAKR